MICNRPSHRGFATFIVLWTIALAAILLVALQSISYKQAAAGRQAVARVKAYWAARAGVEAQIAVLTSDNLTPDQSSAYTVRDDLANAAIGTLKGSASYHVLHAEYPDSKDGALDAHSLLNINTLSPDSMILIPDMDTGIADAVIDWIDDDDDPEPNGAEEGQYLSLKSSYKPRNAPMRSLRELELVVGVRADYLRGEDWNLNGRLDPNEDDGDQSWPPDNADGRLDSGWARYLTAVSDDSLGPGYGLSGEARLDLSTASSEDLAKRLSIDKTQADAIINHVTAGGAMVDFLESDLSTLSSASGNLLNGGGPAQPRAANLTDDQIGILIDEAYIPTDVVGPRTGKVNINTVDRETLEYLAELSTDLAESILTERDGRSGGFVHLTDLLQVPGITKAILAQLYPFFCVKSNVYVAVSRGRDEVTGMEVEIQATLDRSTIPVIIKDLVVR